MTVTIRKHYDTHDRVHPRLDPVSRTHQSAKDECDINNIMAKWQKTGIIEHENRYQGQYGDFTQMPGDFMEAQQAVFDAQEMFMTLPSSVRSKFHNDPGAFLDFASNPANSEEMRKMGLLKPSDEIIEETPPPSSKGSEKPAKPAETPGKTDEKSE